MYLVRSVVHCKPGKVREMVEKFRRLSTVMQAMGHEPLRLLTDVSGGRFWTIVVEATVETIEAFFAIEQETMTDETIRKAMADYHELVDNGRREVYRIES